MKYANIKAFDVANGPGIRVSLFVSGCKHACKGCFNEKAWDFNCGSEFTYETIDEIIKLLKRDFIKGLSLLGGEPLDPANQEWVCYLLREVKKHVPEKNIWCYTGFTYEYIEKFMVPNLEFQGEILDYVDVLVDGRFVLELLDLKLKFRGSSNQRLINIKKTRKEGKIICEE